MMEKRKQYIMKKVLIIGGTGTISSPISKLLSEDKDVELYVLNRGLRKDNLGDSVHRIKGDIRNVSSELREGLEDLYFDSVINFLIMNREDVKTNIDLFKGKCDQFIFISTVVALNHQLSCNVDETLEYGNLYSNYGRNKEECEKLFLKEKDFPVTIVRPTQTYSNERIPLSLKGKTYWSVCSRMIKGKEVIVHGDGQGVWAGTHASDFGRLFIPLVGRKEAIGEIYQIMNPESYTWDMIYQTLADELGGVYRPVYINSELLDGSRKYNWKESIHGDKHFSNIFDIAKIRKLNSDFEFAIDMKKGVKMFVEYMNSHPELKKEDPEFDRWCDDTIEKYRKLKERFLEEIE